MGPFLFSFFFRHRRHTFQTWMVTSQVTEILKKKAALADLISPPLQDGRHVAQPHGDHVVDGVDQLPSVPLHGPWRPPN